MVCARADAETLRPGRDYALISITDPGAAEVALPEDAHRRALLRLEFPNIRVSNGVYSRFTVAHATRIVSFVNDLSPDVRLIVVQCEFGRSRSAAVAAAILERDGRDASHLFDERLYRPNELVLKTMRAIPQR